MDMWLVYLILGELAFLAFVFWIVSSYKLKRNAQVADERLRLVERFSSADELAAFLESEPGQHYQALFRPRPDNPRGMLVATVGGGILCLAAGGGFLLLGRFGYDFMVPGVLAPLVGVGLLISAVIARRILDGGNPGSAMSAS